MAMINSVLQNTVLTERLCPLHKTELGSIPEDREETGKKATVDIGKRKNN